MRKLLWLGQLVRWVVCALFLGLAGTMLIPLLGRVYNVGSLFFLALGLLGALVCIFWPRILRFVGKKKSLRVLSYAVLVLFAAGVVWCGYLLTLMGSALEEVPAEKENATLLVLGSQVNGETPSLNLQMRIDKAAEWLLAHPGAMAVACGGKGDDELISEAEAIRRGLVAQGISADRILLEDKSTTTRENLKNARQVLSEKGLSSEDALITTDDYHMYRAISLAREEGFTAWGVPVPSVTKYFPALYARELIALTNYLVLG